ncbi:hypothetical protein IFR05_003979 [Cadophora sp. M221]|nr:hypothetical protein IFR05_003979 [Cadophora sp. M221]
MAHADYGRIPLLHDDRPEKVHKRKALELFRASSFACLIDYAKRPKLIEDNQLSYRKCHGFSHIVNQEQEDFAEQPIHHGLSTTAEQATIPGFESGSEGSYVDSDSSDHMSQSTATSRSSSHTPECDNGDLNSSQPQYHPLISHEPEELISVSLTNCQPALSHDILQSCSAGNIITGVIELPPVIVLEQGKPLSEDPDHNTPENSSSNDSSTVTSIQTTVHSHTPALSTMEIDEPTTDGDDSSQSRESSDVSEPITEDTKSRFGNDLEDLIKNDLLLGAPEQAEYFYQSVKGDLVCASRKHLAHVDQSHGVSLLQLVELEAFGLSELRELTGAISLASSSSSSSASASYIQYTSTGSVNGTGDSLPSFSTTSDYASKEDREDETPDQLLKPKKKGQKSTSPEEPKASGEHMKSHHTKPVKKLSQLQCSRCQDEFSDQEELKAHELDVDCPVRCIDCREEFATKALRQQHQKLTHQEEAIECIYMELDESKWKSISKNLKGYTDSLKKGKGRVDPVLDGWIAANIAQFEVGRTEKAKASAKLELGQWYTMYKTLVPQARIDELPTHPFYDSGIPHSEYAQEKLIYINDRMVEAKINAYGPPPTDIDSQIGWFRDALRDSVKVSARTNAPHLLKETPFVPRDSGAIPGLYRLNKTENTIQSGSCSLMTARETNANLLPPISSTADYVSTAQFREANQMSQLSNDTTLNSHESDINFEDWPVNPNDLGLHEEDSELFNFETVTYSGLSGADYGTNWTGRPGGG